MLIIKGINKLLFPNLFIKLEIIFNKLVVGNTYFLILDHIQVFLDSIYLGSLNSKKNRLIYKTTQTIIDGY